MAQPCLPLIVQRCQGSHCTMLSIHSCRATIAHTLGLNRDQENVLLSTVGFGTGDYNDPMLERLADTGNGNYAYVDTLDAARRIFVQNLTGTLQVIAKDAKMQVEFNPALVASYRLIGYDNRAVADADFRNDSVDAGEVGARSFRV